MAPNLQSARDRLFSSRTKIMRCQPGEGNKLPYVPLYLQGLMMGEHLPFPLYVKTWDAAAGKIKFIPYIAEGEPLAPAWLAPLQHKGIDRLYFRREDLDRVIAYLNNHMLVLHGEGQKMSKARLRVMTEHLNLSLRRAFYDSDLGPALALAQSQVERLLTEMRKDAVPLKFVWEMLYHDYNLYNHSINVCLLCLAFTRFMKKFSRESRHMGMAGLLHDVGMTRIADDILFKAGTLTQEELSELERHPHLSHRLLQGQARILPDCLRLILEHHENADGSGYPQGLPLTRQHPWTRFIRILDAYDFLTSNLPHRPAQTPFAALKTLQEGRGAHRAVFEPWAFKAFIKFLALS